MRRKYRNNYGYIALVAVSVISLIMTGIVISVNFGGYFTRYTILTAEYKAVSESMARSCVDIALVMVVLDPKLNGNYTGIEADLPPADGGEKCAIVSVEHDGGGYKVVTKAAYRNSLTSLESKISLDGGIYKIKASDEIPADTQ